MLNDEIKTLLRANLDAIQNIQSDVDKIKDLLAREPRFKKPTLDELRTYLANRNSSVDAEAFYTYYDSVGWKVGKKPMKSWKSCVATWEKSDKKKDEDSIIVYD